MTYFFSDTLSRDLLSQPIMVVTYNLGHAVSWLTFSGTHSHDLNHQPRSLVTFFLMHAVSWFTYSVNKYRDLLPQPCSLISSFDAQSRVPVSVSVPCSRGRCWNLPGCNMYCAFIKQLLPAFCLPYSTFEVAVRATCSWISLDLEFFRVFISRWCYAFILWDVYKV